MQCNHTHAWITTCTLLLICQTTPIFVIILEIQSYLRTLWKCVFIWDVQITFLSLSSLIVSIGTSILSININIYINKECKRTKVNWNMHPIFGWHQIIHYSVSLFISTDYSKLLQHVVCLLFPFIPSSHLLSSWYHGHFCPSTQTVSKITLHIYVHILYRPLAHIVSMEIEVTIQRC